MCVVCKCGVRVEWLLTDALGVSVYVAKCLKHVTALMCLCVCVWVSPFCLCCALPVSGDPSLFAIFVLVFVFVVCATSCIAVSP